MKLNRLKKELPKQGEVHTGILLQKELQERELFLQEHRDRFLFCPDHGLALFRRLSSLGSCSGGYISFLFRRQCRQEAVCQKQDRV